ncbi:hypothetical protein HRbin15_02371 [bacterium HR15]|nr:hypothetical protein HRbin15_02371 [bacterium HR15]
MKPAARVGDSTAHGSPLAPGPGSPNVFIGNRPAWRAVIDQHACPAVNISGPDGVGNVLVGSPTVLINNQMACRLGDTVIEKPGAALGPMNPIVMGCPTVLIGEGSAASQIAVTITALINAAKSGLPLIQICPECRLLKALTGQHKLPLGDRVAAGKDLYDAVSALIRSARAAEKALQYGPDTPLTAVKKVAARAPRFDWKWGAGMGALKTALNNLDDLRQGNYAAFGAKVVYGAARGLAGEFVGSLAAKGGAALGAAFPPLGGALGGAAVGKMVGTLFGSKKAEKVDAVVGALIGGAIGCLPVIGHGAGTILGAIGAKMWAAEATEAGIDKLTGGEERIDQFFRRRP